MNVYLTSIALVKEGEGCNVFNSFNAVDSEQAAENAALTSEDLSTLLEQGYSISGWVTHYIPNEVLTQLAQLPQLD